MTSETPTPLPAGGRSRWWNILFGLSLAVNLAVIGAVAGHRFADGPPARGMYMQLLPREFFRDLPRERRRELMQIMRPNMGEMGNLRDAMMAAGLNLADALEKQPYDAAQVQQALSGVVSRNQSVMMEGSTLLANFISKLTPEERALLAKAIRERKPFRRP